VEARGNRTGVVCLIRRRVSARASVTRRVQEERTCAFLLLQRRLLTLSDMPGIVFPDYWAVELRTRYG